MDYFSSPIVKKIVGEITSNQKRRFAAPNEVCLGDWWLSKPDDGVGVSVGGYPFEMRRSYNTRHLISSSAKKRYAMREFESKQIVKRHDCNRLESSDGLMVYLCGFINRFRTKENGFSPEACRDFYFGFPLNWEVSSAQCVVDKQSNSDHESLLDHTITTAIDSSNGAHMHDLFLSVSDIQRDAYTKKVYDDLLRALNPELINTTHTQPPKLNPASPVDADFKTPVFGENVVSSDGSKKGRKRVKEEQRTEKYLDKNDKRLISECKDFSGHKYSMKHDILTPKCSTMMKAMNSGVSESGNSSERQTSSVRRSRRLVGKKAVRYAE